MAPDLLDAPTEFSDPVIAGPHQFRSAMHRRRRLAWVLGACGAVLAVQMLLARDFLGAVVFLLVVGIVVFQELRWWPRLRFCPACDALVEEPGKSSPGAFCGNCSMLLDPARLSIGPTRTFDCDSPDRFKHSEAMVCLVAVLICVAVNDKATEVRLEYRANKYRIWSRVGGTLFEMVPPPAHLHLAIAAVIKAIANVEPFVETEPHGQFMIKHGGKVIAARVHVEPAESGETTVVEIDYDVNQGCRVATAQDSAGR